MNAEVLLTHFNRISDAPDAIPRLRRFILDLAVRGKLTEHDSADEPASELLKRIQPETVPLGTRVKQIVGRKELPRVDPQKAPFFLPPGWVWARFPELGVFGRGKSKHRPRNDPALFEGGKHLLVQTGDVARSNGIIKTFTSRYNDVGLAQSLKWPKGTLCITIAANIADSGILSFDACFPDSVVGFVPAPPIPSARYFEYFVRTAKRNLLEFAPATAQKNINLEILNAVLVPLPPLPELGRVVAKVDELMALCDRLEAVGKEREDRRTTLTAASFHHLDSESDANLRRQHTSFVLGHLPHLTVRSNQINRLRQTVLNLATRGQLVRQDPNDEPAPELLIRIQAEKARLYSEGVTKKLDSTELPEASCFPFALPLGWAASSLQSLCISVTDGDHLPPPKSVRGIPFLVIGNVRSQTLDFAGCRHVSEEYYNALDAIRRPRRGDILYTLVGSYGIPVIVRDDKPFCVQRHIGILRPTELVNIPFLSRVLESRWVFDQATACATGIAQKTVPLSGLRKILIPLPPLAEQRRIVAKVDELMKLCDELESRLSDTQSERHRLLEAILHQALFATTSQSASSRSRIRVPTRLM